jgi:putative ubiquitin-RnfH superfamily antitoxin RatB of RatAB toxin-antitoxin module
MIAIEIVYAGTQQQVIKSLLVTEQTTVLTAIQQSEILAEFPEIDLTKNKVGIFSKVVSLDHIVQQDDRIEIYRALLIDPKQARLNRAKLQKKNSQQ